MIISQTTTVIMFDAIPRLRSSNEPNRHFLSRKEARYWNAKLDHWLSARNNRPFKMSDSIRADVAAAK